MNGTFFKQLFEHFIGEVVIHQHLDAQCFGTEKSGKKNKMKAKRKNSKRRVFWRLALTEEVENCLETPSEIQVGRRERF